MACFLPHGSFVHFCNHQSNSTQLKQVRCLLAPPPSKKDIDAKAAKLDIKQGSNGLMTVPGLVSQPVEDTNGVLDAFERGNATRSVASTAMNATSSRSHMVLPLKSKSFIHFVHALSAPSSTVSSLSILPYLFLR